MKIEKGWTVAFRRPRANRVLRVDDLNVTWSEAVEIAGKIATEYPELEVWYVSTADAEDRGLVAFEDRRNVMSTSGRRVRIFEGGKRATFSRVFPFASLSDSELAAIYANVSEIPENEVRTLVLAGVLNEQDYRS